MCEGSQGVLTNTPLVLPHTPPLLLLLAQASSCHCHYFHPSPFPVRDDDKFESLSQWGHPPAQVSVRWGSIHKRNPAPAWGCFSGQTSMIQEAVFSSYNAGTKIVQWGTSSRIWPLAIWSVGPKGVFTQLPGSLLLLVGTHDIFYTAHFLTENQVTRKFVAICLRFLALNVFDYNHVWIVSNNCCCRLGPRTHIFRFLQFLKSVSISQLFFVCQIFRAL